MQLNLLYVASESIGYGRLGVFLAEALEDAGVSVYNHLPGTEQDPRSEPFHGRKAGRCNTVCWVSVPTHARGWWKGQRACLFTMWEATKLPPSFRENIDEFETLIVPSAHNVELFSKYHPDVRCVPLGVNPADWYPIKRTEPDRFFRFLIGGSGKRKGTDLAHSAFRKAFPRDRWDGPVPVLVMKNPKGEPFHGDRVEMVTGRIGAQDEIDLYASAHCYLQPSRGEGFGLQPLQAIAQGLPTILTDAHGHEAFAHLGIPLSWKYSKADYFIYGDAGDWWEPSLDELIDAMRWVYDNYDEASRLAAVNANKAAEFTWAKTAQGFLDAIGRDQLGPYEGPEEWHTADLRFYPVVLNRDWVADIGGVKYSFAAGREYFEPADVKRIAFEAGLLDPVCLEGDDTGLASSQARQIPGYTASHSHCPTCQQPLNSRPTRSDELFAEMSR